MYIPRSWLNLFLYSAFALAGMSVLWLVIQDTEFRFDISHLGMRYVAGNGLLNDAKDTIVTQAISAEDSPANKFANKCITLDFIGDRNIIEIENQNDRNDKLQTPWKVFTNGINQDTPKRFSLEKKRKLPSPSTSSVHPKKTSVAHLQPTTRNVYSSQPSKQSLFYVRSQRAKVYGEQGCPDNPWRGGLSELVHAWTNISKQHNIEYVLACGSLLGAMRDSDVIPYDSDVDILVDINYYPILKSLAVERRYIGNSDAKIHLVLQPEFTLNILVESRKRYDCQGKETATLIDQCSFQEPMGRLFKGNLHIDIFHFYERVHYVEDPSESKLKQYRKKDFYPFRSCSFMGFEASCPNKPWEILRLYFDTDNFEPIYKCKNGAWVDNNGLAADVI